MKPIYSCTSTRVRNNENGFIQYFAASTYVPRLKHTSKEKRNFILADYLAKQVLDSLMHFRNTDKTQIFTISKKKPHLLPQEKMYFLRRN
jgi:hypothetical protein